MPHTISDFWYTDDTILVKYDPFWTDLIQSDLKKCNLVIVEKSILISFDPFWTDLIQSDQKMNDCFYPHGKCNKFL